MDSGTKSLNTDTSPLLNETLSCVNCKLFKQASKFLNCNHVICSNCLTALVIDGSIECSMCNLLTPAPNGGVDLEDNFMTQHCINRREVLENIGTVPCTPCCLGKSTPSELFCVQCNQYMCQIDWNAHKNFVPGGAYHVFIDRNIQTESGAGAGQFLVQTSFSQLCREHPSYSMELYCSDCRALICASCIVVAHKGHVVREISEAIKTELSDFSKCRESLEEKIDACKQKLQQSEQKKGALEEERGLKRDEIVQEFEDSLALIVGQRDKKLFELGREFDDVINTLFIQTQQLESTLNQLYQAIRLTQSCDVLSQCNIDQLSLIPKITDRLLSLTETIPKQKPIQSSLGASLHSNPEVGEHKYSMKEKKPSHKFGESFNLNKTRAIASGEGGDVFVVDKGNALIHAFSPEGKQKFAFGKYGRGPGEFKNPWGLCLQGKRLWVSDSSMGIVMSFTLEGTYLSRFGAWGMGPGEFQSPKGLCADAKGCLWVADCDNNRIQRFEQNGKNLSIIPHDDSIVMLKPVDVAAVLHDDSVWVLTGSDPAVFHVSSEGELLTQFASLGKGRALVHPISLFYDDTTRCVLVADTAVCSVTVFNEAGVVDGRLSLQGIKSYSLHGVTVDKSGRVLCTAKCVYVFTF